uniref:Carboxylesterase type B domain-containing protein n=1 Tax=Plectus sambesii TaxID=2011161 RepID=A0A914XAM3_9BILA
MMATGNEVYLYSFDYFNPKSFGLLSWKVPFKAATHCTELAYLFGVGIIFSFKFNELDNEMIDIMTKLWTNFAKHGNPNGNSIAGGTQTFNWEPISEDHCCRYLSIGSKPQMREDYANGNSQFWAEVASQAINVENDTEPAHDSKNALPTETSKQPPLFNGSTSTTPVPAGLVDVITPEN